MGGRERNEVLNDQSGVEVKSAAFRRNPRIHAGTRKKKGQPRVVGLCELVEAARIEHASAAGLPHSPLHAYPGLCI